MGNTKAVSGLPGMRPEVSVNCTVASTHYARLMVGLGDRLVYTYEGASIRVVASGPQQYCEIVITTGHSTTSQRKAIRDALENISVFKEKVSDDKT